MLSTGPTSADTTVPVGSWWSRARRSHLGVAAVVALTLFTDMLTYGAVLPVLPTLIIKKLKGDSSMVGFLFGCYAFGLLVATPVFAILSDKYQNRRLPMMAGCLGLMASTLSFAAAETYPLLVVARVAQGVAGGASWTIGLGLLADVFPTKRLGVVMGTVLTAHTVGFAIGPAMGGFLYEYGGYSAPFLCCAAFALLNFFAIVWIAEPPHDKHTKKPTQKYTQPDDDDAKQAPITIWSLCKNWRILCCVLCTTVSSSVFSGIEPALPIHLEKTYDASASTVGLVFVAMVVPAFLAPLIGHLSDRIGRYVISATGMLVMAVASPLVAVHYPTVYMIIPALMVFGFSSPLTLTPILPEMGEVVDELGGSAYAQVYALYNMAYSAGMFFGPNCAGLIMTYAGFEALMITFGVVLVVCSPIMMDWKAVWRRLVGGRGC
ncbi:major facilitator superfamily domain-containing protein [Zychaea mexicana]|uniref:major facilitator superfamily domain-containing protein n=1 Tax=Zychaea mexicana TaxID=64656 RepID=UPI0022FDF358|nr:major facilitator superfamily domain-containing protein [Zychaea mexicana]KAI9484748.1 major facilitator superfamily domain-containing protein [Zychaea mexicana]